MWRLWIQQAKRKELRDRRNVRLTVLRVKKLKQVYERLERSNKSRITSYQVILDSRWEYKKSEKKDTQA